MGQGGRGEKGLERGAGVYRPSNVRFAAVPWMSVHSLTLAWHAGHMRRNTAKRCIGTNRLNKALYTIYAICQTTGSVSVPPPFRGYLFRVIIPLAEYHQTGQRIGVHLGLK